MADETDRDRIVKLETKQEYQHGFNDQVLSQLTSIEKEVRIISDWIQQKTGFIGGIIFCCSIAAAIIGAAASYVWEWIHGH